MSYLVGIDIGGTFTDCAIVDRAGRLLTTKVPSTPPDFARGMMDALGAGAEALGLSLDGFCRDIAFLSHGTTVGTNTIIQKRGAKVGLVTTKGHEDAIHIMRGSRGYGGRDIRKVVHFPETAKPAPIVPKRLIRGISERVDCFGEIVVALNEREAEAAIRELLDLGVEAIAICFLWSFRNPAHENRVKEMVQSLAPDVFVTTSISRRSGASTSASPPPRSTLTSGRSWAATSAGWTSRCRSWGTGTACRSPSAAAARCRSRAPERRRS